MYYSPHDEPGGICLACTDKLEGPWKEYEANPLISNHWAPRYSVSHVSGPHAIWNDEESKLFLYLHAENNTRDKWTPIFLSEFPWHFRPVHS
jgi:hypothetical protein